MSDLERVTIALDWTPNTNHTGFYVARAKGFFEKEGLQVELLSPHTDAYKATPASRLIDGSAQFACTPSESVISYHTWPGSTKPKIVAVATLLQDSTSAIVTLKSSGLDRPAKLDGKVYASYAARYEGRIVQQMIKADGGVGNYVESTPAMLGIWNTLLQGQADATWVFLGWEGVAAQRAGLELNSFRPEDYGVAYGYSPVLAALPELLSTKPQLVRSVLAATSLGYAYAAAHPEEAAQLLCSQVEADTASCPLPEPLDPAMVADSQRYVSPHYLDPQGRWGVMQQQQWEAFLDWLSNSGLLTSKVQSREAGADEGSSATSLDGLRAGDVGEPVPRSSISVAQLATSEYLP